VILFFAEKDSTGWIIRFECASPQAQNLQACYGLAEGETFFRSLRRPVAIPEVLSSFLGCHDARERLRSQ
jgi:hypothetical protein